METEKRFFNSEIEVRAADGKTTLRAYAVKYNELSRPIGWQPKCYKKFSFGGVA